MVWNSVAVVMPSYNEEDGIASFLLELDDVLAPLTAELTFVVVDDASTDSTMSVLEESRSLLNGGLRVVSNSQNQGHGPTAVRCYQEGLRTACDAIIHVDGDGQFQGKDFPRVLAALEGADCVRGHRCGRTDPWYRKAITSALCLALLPLTRTRADTNTPLRAYRRDTLAALISQVPRASVVPHVHLTLLERRSGCRLRTIRVASRPRRGATQVGTMWGSGSQFLRSLIPPVRLLRFCATAMQEVLRTWAHPERPAPTVPASELDTGRRNDVIHSVAS